MNDQKLRSTYQGSFSEALLDAMDRDPDTVWDDQYYDAVYTDANAFFDDIGYEFRKGRPMERTAAIVSSLS